MDMYWWQPETMLFADPGEAVVEKRISADSKGRAAFLSSHYPAKSYNSKDVMVPGERVKVLGIQGICLLCAPRD